MVGLIMIEYLHEIKKKKKKENISVLGNIDV